MSTATENKDDDELVDYDEEPQAEPAEARQKKEISVKKGSYVGIHSSGFRDLLLRPELINAVTDCGFEHPSEVQQECIPQAVLGMDIICQAKSGMGKTAVFVLAVLQQLVPVEGTVDTLVLCHTRELAFQICQEFMRFSKYLPEVKVKVFFGGIEYKLHKDILAKETPHIVIGTPGRILQLAKDKALKLTGLKRFVLDECDKMLESLDMRRDVQNIFKMTPHEKQVMMFSATLSKEIRPVCRKFTQTPVEIYIDNESKLTLHGLQQYYVKLTEAQKNRKLNDLLDALDFNQVVIFVNGVRRCKELNKLLLECNFPSICTYGGLAQEERLQRYNMFKEARVGSWCPPISSRGVLILNESTLSSTTICQHPLINICIGWDDLVALGPRGWQSRISLQRRIPRFWSKFNQDSKLKSEPFQTKSMSALT